MENQIQTTEQSIPLSTEEPITPPKSNRSLIAVFVATSILVVAGSVFAGIQIGKNQQPEQILQEDTGTTVQTPQPFVDSATSLEVITPSDPLESWNTFDNALYNFSFNYPSTWQTTNCNNEKLLLLSEGAEPSCIDLSGGDVVFEVSSEGEPALVENFTSGYTLEPQEAKLDTSITKFYLASEDPKIPPSISTLYITALANNQLLQVIVFEKSNESIAEQMLSSLRVKR